MKLSEKIIASRKKQGLSQVDLADALGVSRQSVSKWETDEAKPDINKLPALAKALGVTIDWLLSEDDAEDSRGESSCEDNHTNRETVVKNYPDWVEKAPGFMKTAIKKYGWIYGVKFIISGVLFTIFGIVARVMSYRFIFGGSNHNTYGTFTEIGGVELFAENSLPVSDAWVVGAPDYLGGGAFTAINNQAWSAFSTITGLIIGIGIVMIIGGIVITVILRRWSRKED